MRLTVPEWPATGRPGQPLADRAPVPGEFYRLCKPVKFRTAAILHDGVGPVFPDAVVKKGSSAITNSGRGGKRPAMCTTACLLAASMIVEVDDEESAWAASAGRSGPAPAQRGPVDAGRLACAQSVVTTRTLGQCCIYYCVYIYMYILYYYIYTFR
jgi:hypothetical protein